MENKEIVIIIITYNSEGVISKCLSQLSLQSHKNFKLIVIDNASKDDTLNKINTYLQSDPALNLKTEIIQSKTNIGFARGVNLGIKRADKLGSVYAIQLLNPDVELAPSLLEHGLQALHDNPGAGACSPVILYPDKRIWWIGTRVLSDNELLFGTHFGISKHTDKGQLFSNKMQRYTLVESLTGCSMLILKKAIDKIGLFNEKYFMYVEDIDYSLRLRKNNFKLFLFANSSITHKVQDQHMNSKILLRNLKKYKIYLTSVLIFLYTHKPVWLTFIWTTKLPLVGIYTFLERKNKK